MDLLLWQSLNSIQLIQTNFESNVSFDNDEFVTESSPTIPFSKEVCPYWSFYPCEGGRSGAF